MIQAFERRNVQEARRIHYKLLSLIRAIFIETNPIPVKTAMGLMGLIRDPSLRLPLCPMSEGNLAKLQEVLRSSRLLKR